MPGNFGVSTNGAATYNVPIEVPPGIAGVGPSLAFNYGSQRGNGLMGTGWALAGLSVIRRCGANIDDNGFKGGVHFDNADGMCLDGEHLIAVPVTVATTGLCDANHPNVTEYRTEINGFSRIIGCGSPGIGPEYFKVWTKAGLYMEYGVASDAQVTLSGNAQPLLWPNDKIVDRDGNYIDIHYHVDATTGEYYPTVLQYTGNANASLNPNRVVLFVYENRPSTDVLTTYKYGVKTLMNLRLADVKTYIGASVSAPTQLEVISGTSTGVSGTLVKDYRISYEAAPGGAPSDYRSRLASIQECSSSDCFPATQFHWRPDGTATFATATPAVPFTDGDKFDTWNRFVDFNGDGVPDIFQVTDTTAGTVRILFGSRDGSGTISYAAGPSTTNAITVDSSGFGKWNELGDINGDGYIDIFQVLPANPQNYTTPSSQTTFQVVPAQVRFGNPDGSFSAPTAVAPIVTYQDNGFRYDNELIDMDGDGRADLFRIIETSDNSDGFYQVLLGKGDGTFYGDGTTSGEDVSYSCEPDSGPYSSTCMLGVVFGGTQLGFRKYNQLADMDGDGVVDLFRVVEDGNGEVSVLTGHAIGNGRFGFTRSACDPGQIDGGCYGITRSSISAPSPGDAYFNFYNQLVDINGDGNLDVVVVQTDSSDPQYDDVMVLFGKGNGYFEPAQSAALKVVAKVNAITSTGFIHNNHLMDINADGYMDIVRLRMSDSSDYEIQVLYGRGDGTFSAPVDTGIDLYKSGVGDSFSDWNRLADLDGDGVVDITTIDKASKVVMFHRSNQSMPGLVDQITDGNQLETTIDAYKPLTDDSVYGAAADAVSYPLRDARIPQYVVAQSTVHVSTGDNFTNTYHYYGARQSYYHGWLGFERMVKANLATGLQTDTTYEQEFPFTGLIKEVKKELTSNPDHIFSDTANTWDKRAYADGQGNTYTSYFAYLKQRIATTYEPNANWAQISQKQTDYQDDASKSSPANIDDTPYDKYGNPEQVVVSFDDGHVTTTDNVTTYDESQYYPGQVQQATQTVVNKTPLGDVESLVNQESYYTTDGLLQTSINGVGQPLATATHYTYDEYGEKATVTVGGWDGTYDASGAPAGGGSVTRETDYSYTGQNGTELVVTRTRDPQGASLVDVTSIDNRWGMQTQAQDPNGVLTTTNYDSMGRESSSVAFSGTPQAVTSTTTYSSSCDTDCPPGAAYLVTQQASDNAGTTLPGVTVYYDNMQRALRTQHIGFGGEVIYADTAYDTAGRVHQVSRNYFKGGNPEWTITTYDDIGRVLTVTSPNNAETVYTYAGRTTDGIKTTVENDKTGRDETTTHYTDSTGKLVRIDDAYGNRTTYVYGPFGKLDYLVDPQGNVTTITHDVFGNRIVMDDPDMGVWRYAYNAFGDMKWQKNAKGDVTQMNYDGLGRMTNRSEAWGTTAWTYDTAAHGKGLLASVDNGSKGYQEVYSYDSVGRKIQTDVTVPATTISGTTIDSAATYTVKVDYDGFSRALHNTYPNNGLEVTNQYNADGYLSQVVDTNNTSVVYWQANSRNADDQVTDLTLGNGLDVQHSYYPETGLPHTIQTGSLQNLTYVFDNLGNLTSRQDSHDPAAVKTETFGYDNLNRLTTSDLNGTQNLGVEYDALGNITHKTDVGYYHYDGLRPHAVTSIDGSVTSSGTLAGDANGDGRYDAADIPAAVNQILGYGASVGNADCTGDTTVNTQDVVCIINHVAMAAATITYDDNGNMLADTQGRAITYTSFDKPETIIKGSASVTLEYDTGYNRVKKVVSSSGSVQTATTYIGKLYEHVVDHASGTTDDKYYIYAGGRAISIMTRHSGGTTDTDYLLTDELGSIDVITDASGAEVKRFSYDAFGQRRMPDWSPSSDIQALLSNVTTRGFTGQESDDEVGLVNMNARLYDPFIGRFITPDSVTPDPTSPQLLNRYAYANNNPASLIDPSGHIPILPDSYAWIGLTDDVSPPLDSDLGGSDQLPYDGGQYVDFTRMAPNSFGPTSPDLGNAIADQIAQAADFTVFAENNIPTAPDYGGGISLTQVGNGTGALNTISGTSEAMNPFMNTSLTGGMSGGNQNSISSSMAGINSSGAGSNAFNSGSNATSGGFLSTAWNGIKSIASGVENFAEQHPYVTAAAETVAMVGISAITDGAAIPLFATRLATITEDGIGADTVGEMEAQSAVRGISSNSPRYVYRSGSATQDNLTPRLTDMDGLSTFDTLEGATGPGGKAQVIDTTKLRCLFAVCDPEKPGHVLLTPGSETETAAWAATRGTGILHPYTQDVMDSIVDTVRRPK